MHGTLTLSAAAKKIGISPITLRRWLLSGRITGVAKDRNGWWIFEPQDIERIIKWKNYRYYPNIKQKKMNEKT